MSITGVKDTPKDLAELKKLDEEDNEIILKAVDKALTPEQFEKLFKFLKGRQRTQGTVMILLYVISQITVWIALMNALSGG